MSADPHTKFLVQQMNALHLHYFLQDLSRQGPCNVNEWLAVAEAERLRRHARQGEPGYIYRLRSGDLFWARIDGGAYVMHPLAQ